MSFSFLIFVAASISLSLIPCFGFYSLNPCSLKQKTIKCLRNVIGFTHFSQMIFVPLKTDLPVLPYRAANPFRESDSISALLLFNPTKRRILVSSLQRQPIFVSNRLFQKLTGQHNERGNPFQCLSFRTSYQDVFVNRLQSPLTTPLDHESLLFIILHC